MHTNSRSRGATGARVIPRSVAALAAVAVLGACGTTSYKPAVERQFSQVAAEGCGSKGDVVIVTGQVTKAYENTVTMWDGMNPEQTLTVNLRGRGSPLAKMRQWFGTSRYELTAERLNQLSAERQPVTVTMECRGGRVPATARSIEFANPDGTRVAIGY